MNSAEFLKLATSLFSVLADFCSRSAPFAKAIAWPCVVIFLVVSFSKNIRKLADATCAVVDRIKEADIHGTKLIMTVPQAFDEVRQLTIRSKTDFRVSSDEIDLNATFLAIGLEELPGHGDMNEFRRIAEKNPTLAVLGVFKDVEVMLLNLGKTYKILVRTNETTPAFVRRLEAVEALEPRQSELIQAIWVIGVAAREHGYTMTMEQAQEVLEAGEMFKADIISWLKRSFLASLKFKIPPSTSVSSQQQALTRN